MRTRGFWSTSTASTVGSSPKDPTGRSPRGALPAERARFRHVCGICGFVGPPDAAVHRGVIEAMSETIRHRGPDAGGAAEIASDLHGRPLRGWLGNRRLRIIDVRAAADQPMVR